MTRSRIQPTRTPADPYFSTNARVAPGHFIGHDNGMDCQNMGGAEVCDPPNGTVHYFDPDQNLPCTRTGATAICSNPAMICTVGIRKTTSRVMQAAVKMQRIFMAGRDEALAG